jgi:hypothetical protein
VLEAIKQLFDEVEKPYKFIDVETLVADFLADIEQSRKG